VTARFNSKSEKIKGHKKIVESIYNNIDQGVCLHKVIYDGDKPVDYQIIEANLAYEKILGIPLEKAKNSLGSKLYGSNKAPYLETYIEVAQTGNVVEFEDYFSPMGKYFNITVTSPEKGQFITLFSDITERKIREQKLRENREKLEKSKKQYKKLAESAHAILWEYDILNDNWDYVAPQVETILGYKPKEWTDLEFWVNHVHPEDRQWAKDYCLECSKQGQDHVFEYRFFKKSGEIAWIRDEVNVEMKDEKPVKIRGLIIDVTQRKEKEKELEEKKEELQASNQQLEAYNQEIIAMNEELDESLVEVNKLNNRFVSMINVVSHLDENINDEVSFLSNLLHSAINIVPEADYGKIFIVDENNYCRLIDTIGHDIDILKNITVNKDILFHSDDQDIYTSGEYSLDINKIPPDKKEVFTSALKNISKSIYINITVNNKVIARISLDIAAGRNKKFSSTTKNILRTFATLASSFFSFQRYNKLQDQFDRELITSIIQLLELYDTYTKGHSENVAEMAADIAENMNLSQREIKDSYWSGMVHDIGKLIVPLNILNKKGRLSESEYELIKRHSTWSFKALNKSETLNHVARYVLYHHERWDGKGYPEGLTGHEIPLISQILAVADAWDAMSSKRSYRDSLGKSRALQEVKENKGTQFSPDVVESLLDNEIIDEQAP
jgi:PAS domain S-box-containing protein